MLTRQETNDLIANTVKRSILSYARNSLRKTPHFQILDLVIPKERKIRSIVGGLETSLGTTLWEPLSLALARHNGFEVIEQPLTMPSNMPQHLGNLLQNIIDERFRLSEIYNAESSQQEIKRACQAFLRNPINDFVPAPRGYGVDIWLRKNDINYIFDIKTVQPNVGALRSCLSQILTWYAYFYAKYPDLQVEARIVFPYNPYRGAFFDGVIGRGKPLEAPGEAWVENEFWDFCSGHEDTFSLITQAFQRLRESGEIEGELQALLDR